MIFFNEYENNKISYFLNRLWNSFPVIVRNLLLVNTILFIASLINQEFIIRHFAMFYPSSPFFRPWQILSHMFVHGNLFHFLLNMYPLLIFAGILERNIGSRKLLLLFFFAGLGAIGLHLGVQYLQIYFCEKGLVYGPGKAVEICWGIKNSPIVGASGAVYGVLMAYAMLFPDNVLTLIFPPISLKAKWLILIFAVFELSFGLLATNDGIAHFAHLGGMLFAAILIAYWKKRAQS